METITQGILLRELEIDDNKWQLIFLNDKGKILKLYASGLGKIDSKNRLNLKEYSLINIEYFASRNIDNNNGKLKKVSLIKSNSIKSAQELFIWNLLSKVLILENNWNISIYDYLNNLIDEEFIILNDIFKFFILVLRKYNYQFEITKCSICGSNQNIASFDLNSGGLVCKNCITNEKELIPITMIKLIELFKYKDVVLKDDENNYFKIQLINFFNTNLGIDISDLKKIN